VDNFAVLDDVILPFEAQLAGSPCFIPSSRALEVGELHDFRPNEGTSEIGMHFFRRADSGRSLVYCPRTDLVGAHR